MASGWRGKHRVSAWALGVVLAAPLVHLLQLSPLDASPAHAAPPRQKAAASKARTKARPRAPSPAAPAAPAAATAPEPPGTSKPGTSKPEAPVAAPASGGAPASDVVRTEEREGEKTYTFGAQEVEGRLKSPQILYFLRRVRAQFDPAPLGHRSFLLELSDTRRHPAF